MQKPEPTAADEAVVAEEWRRLEQERLEEERAEAHEDAVHPGPPHRRLPWAGLIAALAAGIVATIVINALLDRRRGSEVPAAPAAAQGSPRP